VINSLTDPEEFRRHRRLSWEKNVDYWLSQPLRHVEDVGAYIVSRIEILCRQAIFTPPTVIDMGFGSGWLLRSLLATSLRVSYLGLDSMEVFVERATKTFHGIEGASFAVADVETEITFPFSADVVVNAFNFFELSNLQQAMRNASRHLRPGGTLFMSTIDKTYLILALGRTLEDFYDNLNRYQTLPGIKYGFQRIDLGASVSEVLEYPSVLYSSQDFVDAAMGEGLRLVKYVEHAFTAKTVPKIYCHLEFQRL
jgi:SAM-dependent methyltransferase